MGTLGEPSLAKLTQVRFVDGLGGDNATADGSMNFPYKTIQAALNSASSDTLFWITPTDYTENIDFSLGPNNIHMKGWGPTDSALVKIIGQHTADGVQRVRIEDIQMAETAPGDVIFNLTGSVGSYFFKNVSANVSATTKFLEFNTATGFYVLEKCTLGGVVDMNGTPGSGVSLTLRDCTNGGEIRVSHANYTLFSVECPSHPFVTHTAGAVILRNISSMDRNGSGESIDSSAPDLASSLVELHGINLYSGSTDDFGIISITSCDFVLNGLAHDPNLNTYPADTAKRRQRSMRAADMDFTLYPDTGGIDINGALLPTGEQMYLNVRRGAIDIIKTLYSTATGRAAIRTDALGLDLEPDLFPGRGIISVELDKLVFLRGDRTFTSGFNKFSIESTYTVDFVNATFSAMFGLTNTVMYRQDGNIFGSGLLMNHATTYKNDPSVSGVRGIGPIFTFVHQPTFEADGAGNSVNHTQGRDFLSQPRYRGINGGVYTMTSIWRQFIGSGQILTGATLTKRTVFDAGLLSLMTGTLTDCTALNIENLTGQSTNAPKGVDNKIAAPGIQYEGGSGLWGIFTATPVGQQTVTGSRGGNVALASFLTAHANLGWIVDATTP